MSPFKIILPIILTGAVALSWFKLIGSIASEQLGYQECIQKAEESQEKRLYEQAVEYYKSSLNYKYDPEIYAKINTLCEAFYEEEETSYAQTFYINNMLEAANAIETDPYYWIKAIELYKEKNDYASAYSVVKKARNNGVKSEELEQLYLELRYMIQVNTYSYKDFKTAMNGYICVYTADGWEIINHSGKDVSSKTYPVIGLLDDNGRGIYVTDIDTRLLDRADVARARFDFSIEDAGMYSSSSGYVAVLKDKKWQYVDLDGNFLSGKYETAGFFTRGKAAVQDKGIWYLIDESGQQVSEDYEEIKLNLYGSYIQSDMILAKTQGKYHMYDGSLKQMNEFSCDDIDICLEGNGIAYQENGLWGFVDKEGNVMIEPIYQKAKSFSNGMAAVYNGKQWGFINAQNELVIDYQFEYADYFNSNHYCMISTDGESYQLMHLMFE